jgi:hypothetical protein
METDATPHVVALDRVRQWLLVYSSDGSKGYYSDSLSFARLEKSEAFPDNSRSRAQRDVHV